MTAPGEDNTVSKGQEVESSGHVREVQRGGLGSWSV